MTMNPLPPQAYTKETMLKAYQWLMLQDESIKEMATTPDILVSLYLKTTRDGEHSLHRPSIQNFKKELKSLAGIMGDLEKPQQSPNNEMPVINAQPTFVQPSFAQPVASATASAPATTQTLSYTEKTVTATRSSGGVLDILDPQSQHMVREIRDQLNLSSDIEAIRMLVKLGYNKAQGLTK